MPGDAFVGAAAEGQEFVVVVPVGIENAGAGELPGVPVGGRQHQYQGLSFLQPGMVGYNIFRQYSPGIVHRWIEPQRLLNRRKDFSDGPGGG